MGVKSERANNADAVYNDNTSDEAHQFRTYNANWCLLDCLPARSFHNSTLIKRFPFYFERDIIENLDNLYGMNWPASVEGYNDQITETSSNQYFE